MSIDPKQIRAINPEEGIRLIRKIIYEPKARPLEGFLGALRIRIGAFFKRGSSQPNFAPVVL